MSETIAIIPAAGRGLRMGKGKPKQFLELSGKSILSHTLDVFSRTPFISGVFLVVPADFIPEAEALVEARNEEGRRRPASTRGQARRPGPAEAAGCPSLPPFGSAPGEHVSSLDAGENIPVKIIAGGAERQDSVFNAIRNLPAECEWVLIHDGVRPFASPELFRSVWEAARETGAAIAASPATDTVKRVRDGAVTETLPRDEIRLVQTPQVFRKDILIEAYRKAIHEGWSGTDDAFFVERIGVPIVVVNGERTNVKVTTPEDLEWAEWHLEKLAAARRQAAPGEAGRRAAMRVGFGYDVHQFVTDRALFLGGVRIPHTHGLLGHSDADVLLHAICDALLGAAALGDIGRHFPDSDPAYKGISSLLLLEHTVGLVRDKGYRICNIDSTLVLQKPKLAPYIPEMAEKIARCAGIEPERVNVKATTTEKLGFTGREEGVAAYATASIEE